LGLKAQSVTIQSMSDDPNKLVTIAEYYDVLTANQVKSMLEGHQIDAYVQDQNFAQIAQILTPSQAIRLQVRAINVDEAKALIAKMLAEHSE
jgi:hypothetical protein